jgi:hypothetical protein
VRRNTRLGGTVLGVLIGTLVATRFARQLALGVHDPRPFNFAWLLPVTFGGRWIVRRRAIASGCVTVSAARNVPGRHSYNVHAATQPLQCSL